MVSAVMKILSKEFSGLHQAAFILGISALSSQILALLRDRLLANFFGAGQELDIYYTAFRIPDLIYVSIASFVSVTVLIPFIIKKVEADDTHREARRFLNSVLTIFSLVMVLVSGIVYWILPWLTAWIAPGFSGEQQLILVQLSRILLWSPFLLGLSNLLGSVTQAFHKFFAYSLSPIFYNLGIIVGILFFLPRFGLTGLAWGVVLGALAHLLIQLPGILMSKMLPYPVLKFKWREIKEVVLISLPRTVTLFAHQLNLMVLIGLASLLTAGSIAIFNLAFNLQSVPLVIIGVSYSVATFPTLSRLFSNGEREAFRLQVMTAVRHIIFWSVPIISLFIVLRAQIVRVILGTGEFSWVDTRLTAATLAIFVISVAGQGLINLFIRSYYAGGKTYKPLILSLVSSGVTIILALILLLLFKQVMIFRFFIEALLRVSDLPGTIVLMLPLAFTGGVVANTLLLWFYFQKDFGAFGHEVQKTIFQSFATAVVAGFMAYIGLVFWADRLSLVTTWGIFLQGLLAGLMGILVGYWLLVSLGSRELIEFKSSFRRQKAKVELPITPEPEEL